MDNDNNNKLFLLLWRDANLPVSESDNPHDSMDWKRLTIVGIEVVVVWQQKLGELDTVVG